MTDDRIGRRRLLESAGVTLTVGAGALLSSTESSAARPPATVQDDGPYASVYRAMIESVAVIQVLGTDERPGGTGTGFVYDDEHVLTNNHVVAGADEVDLQFADEQWRPGAVAGTDPYSDLAVVAVDDVGDLEALSFSEESPAIGQEVVALGNPLGLDASISQGIVSGLDRSLPSPAGFSIPAAIQTDAPVNPGNSGGPLATLDEEVIGVIFAGAGQNIGFAISAALAERVVPELLEDGTYEHSYLGIATAPFTPLVADAYDTDDTGGVLVVNVVPDSPADGTLEAADEFDTTDEGAIPVGGDVIVAIDGDEIPNQDRLSAYLALETNPGESIEVEIVRDGEPETVELTLDARPEPDAPVSPP